MFFSSQEVCQMDCPSIILRSIITINGLMSGQLCQTNHETFNFLYPNTNSLGVFLQETPPFPVLIICQETNPNSSNVIGCAQLTAWLWLSKRNRDLESKVKALAWRGRRFLFLPLKMMRPFVDHQSRLKHSRCLIGCACIYIYLSMHIFASHILKIHTIGLFTSTTFKNHGPCRDDAV